MKNNQIQKGDKVKFQFHTMEINVTKDDTTPVGDLLIDNTIFEGIVLEILEEGVGALVRFLFKDQSILRVMKFESLTKVEQ